MPVKENSFTGFGSIIKTSKTTLTQEKQTKIETPECILLRLTRLALLLQNSKALQLACCQL
jgi:hypothetical protein